MEGKYGCALMIRLQGPIELRPLSLGKLSSYVQHALNTNLLIYYKTLLIKNNQYQECQPEQPTDQKEMEKLKKIKEQLTELLLMNKGGLSLAQIPILYKKKYNSQLNIQVLGFPKLKNLLATMEEIDLEKTQGSFMKANLKTHIRKASERKLLEESFQNRGDLNGRFYTLRNDTLDYRLNSPYYMNMGNALFSNQNMIPQARACRTVSTVEEYIIKVKILLVEILKQNLYGIELEKLQEALNQKLGTIFDFTICKADSFQEFLVTNLDSYLDVELKKSIKPLRNAGISYIVYPKHSSTKLFSHNRQGADFDCSSGQISPHSFGRAGIQKASNDNSSLYNYQQSKDNYAFDYIGQNKALSWTSVKSTGLPPKQQPIPKESRMEHHSQVNLSNSAKSSQSQYNLFDGLDLEGLNMHFKRRAQRKKKKNQTKLMENIDSAFNYHVYSPQYPRSHHSEEIDDDNNIQDHGSDKGDEDEYSLESTSFRMVEQILDD